MNHAETVLKHLQSLNEDKFTKSVFIPLMQSMGYEDVQFHGGSYEEGKDFIAASLTPFDDYHITVGQVKKFEGKKTSTSRRQYDEIIYQLRACASKKVPYKDGNMHSPTEIIFLTPYIINTRMLSEKFEVQIETPIKIRIIDGSMLVTFINKYIPSL